MSDDEEYYYEELLDEGATEDLYGTVDDLAERTLPSPSWVCYDANFEAAPWASDWELSEDEFFDNGTLASPKDETAKQNSAQSPKKDLLKSKCEKDGKIRPHKGRKLFLGEPLVSPVIWVTSEKRMKSPELQSLDLSELKRVKHDRNGLEHKHDLRPSISDQNDVADDHVGLSGNIGQPISTTTAAECEKAIAPISSTNSDRPPGTTQTIQVAVRSTKRKLSTINDNDETRIAMTDSTRTQRAKRRTAKAASRCLE